MGLKIVIRSLAEEDLDDAITWYNRQREDLGEAFLLEFRQALSIVIINPYAFRKRFRQVRAFWIKQIPL